MSMSILNTRLISQSRKEEGRLALGVIALLMAAVMALVPAPVLAQDVSAQDVAEAPIDAVTVDGGEAATEAGAAEAPAAEAAPTGSYVPMKPTAGKGMPVERGIGFQTQYSDDGQYALWMHNSILMPVITIISLFVLALLLWVVARYRRSANPEPSKTTHNTFIEVVWTVVPALILVGIAFPSLTLLAKQYKSPPEEAVTVKAIGYQWYWGYEYPDHGISEFVSNMLPAEEAIARGEPEQLAVDNRMVVPAGVPLRIQTTAADVIHAFAVPSLWFKIDAVPGRLNERLLTINEPGVYYGQCSELCGARHGYMPITVEALPMDQWKVWVAEQGGTMPGEAEVAEAPAEETADTSSDGEQAASEA
jgi:cytochrome c oxidase subunit 2